MPRLYMIAFAIIAVAVIPTIGPISAATADSILANKRQRTAAPIVPASQPRMIDMKTKRAVDRTLLCSNQCRNRLLFSCKITGQHYSGSRCVCRPTGQRC